MYSFLNIFWMQAPQESRHRQVQSTAPWKMERCSSLPNLKIADHLDYIGCKLYSDYTSTRRENGEIMKKRVRDQIGTWKSGKFLPLTSRPWSLNSYCLSKLWYKTNCLDLRVGDCNAITSSVKGWMYQDKLIKPQA